MSIHGQQTNSPNRRNEMTTYTRAAAKAAAKNIGAKYRITRNGEVHFYGAMPNTNTIGWYLAGWAA